MSTMQAIAVREWGQDPVLVEIPKPSKPTDDLEIQLKIIAAGLPQLVRAQAAGNHYSSAGSSLPFVPGADGVGVTSSGEFHYFSSMATGGAFAEYINVPKAATVPITFPKDLSHDEKVKVAIRIAGIVNPAMASWLAFKTRTRNLRSDFTVLINGVTSLSGQIAISHARALGAGKVIGLGRNADAMQKLGLDQYIVVQSPASTTDFAGQLAGQHVDVILDFIYGESTLHLLQSLPSNAVMAHDLETQYVQIGSLGGLEIQLPSAMLRSKNLTIRGSGPGAWSVTRDFQEQFPGLMERLVEGVGDFEVIERQLEDVKEAWENKKVRSVFVM